MRRALMGVAVPAGIVLGFFAHRPAPPHVPEDTPDRICVAAEPAPFAVQPDCDRVDLATRWCEARLSTLDAPARFSVAAPPVRPDHAQAVTDALARCGVPAEPVSVDCSEAPCVVSLHVGDEAAVSRAINACPELHALGFAIGALQEWPIHCPDGTVSSMWMLTSGDDLDRIAADLVPSVIRESEDLGAAILTSYYLFGQVGRRANQLARSWPCSAP